MATMRTALFARLLALGLFSRLPSTIGSYTCKSLHRYICCLRKGDMNMLARP